MKEKFIKEYLPYIIIIIIVLLIKAFIISPIRVNGESMYSTLHDKDIMILNKVVYRFNKIKRFDVVVVTTNKSPIIKRVIGLPGDKIKYIDNKLYVNDKLVKEKFNHAKTEDFNIKELGSVKVPKGTYFVLGDNRVNSVDSRIIGFVPKKKIAGRAKYIILPFSRIRKVK